MWGSCRLQLFVLLAIGLPGVQPFTSFPALLRPEAQQNRRCMQPISAPITRPSAFSLQRVALHQTQPGAESVPVESKSPDPVPDEGFPPPWLVPFLVPALGGALFGFDIGSSSAVVRILGEKTTQLGKLDALALGQVASGSLFGAMAISAVLIAVGDKMIGRKQELRGAAVLFTLGTVIQSFTANLGLGSVLVGRALYGVGIGTAMHAAPLYIGESAPDNLRGKLVSLKEAAIVLGIVAGYGAGAVFGEGGSWQSVYASALPAEALMFAGTFAIPESSRWLALRGRPDEAVTALQQAQGLTRQQSEAVVQTMSVAGGSEDMLKSLSRLAEPGVTRKALTIGVGLVVFQQLSGQPSVLYYANNVFERAGLGFQAAVGVGVFKVDSSTHTLILEHNEELA